ncbi:AAEL010109-PA [Aedes aegypti]|uniref:AAEL010109-PA n=1 Tax=Aedes aegypti TaxID=7159 RepID=Q16TW6_AEDAE|nr:AAEL010109-PA [Aedes aegypti]
MIIFLYLILVLAWALLIIILKCKKARAKRLAELQEAAQPVHVVQIGSNLYDIMSIQHHHHHRAPYGTVYDCLGTGEGCGQTHRSGANTITHSNAAFIGDDGSVYPGSNIPPLEPPPSYDEVIRLPAHYPKVETFVPEMVVPPPPPPQATAPTTHSEGSSGESGSLTGAPTSVPGMVGQNGTGRVKTISTVMNT